MQLGRTKITGRLGMNFVERVALEEAYALLGTP